MADLNTGFVIVIEADNRRAHAAYLKGLADLDLIWPQLMAHAAEKDAWTNQRIDEEEAKHKREWDVYHAAQRECEEAYKAWKESSSLFRGPEPRWRYIPAPMNFCGIYGRRNSQREHYESIRAELKQKANLAGAALGPFRMTEYQVNEMIAWEDGSRIDLLKDQLLRSQQRIAAQTNEGSTP